MIKTNINYPHPVLNAGNDDYIDSSFDITILDDPKIEGNTISFDIGYSLSCESLETYLATGEVRTVIYIESAVAEFRKIFTFDDSKREISITINKNDVNRKLDVRGYLVSAKSISPFRLPEHNKELFGDIPFLIRPGDILAVSEHFYSIPVDMYDPLADKPSIFSIRQQTDQPNEEIAVDFLSDHKIKILLNNEMYEKYQKLYEAPEVRTVLASFFAAPVLVDVLSFIKYANDDDLEAISSKKWYSVIRARLLALDIDLTRENSMTKVANQVLPHIFKLSIESFRQIFDALIPTGGENNEA